MGIPLGWVAILIENDSMATQGSAWSRFVLHALSVVLGVGMAVACNQILTDGRWSWWWTGLALALAAGGTVVTHRLTRTAVPGRGAVPAASRGPSDQAVDDSTVGGNVTQIRGVTGSVSMHGGPRPAVGSGPDLPIKTEPLMPDGPTTGQVGDETEPPPQSGQRVSRSRVIGSVTQIDGVAGDVTIERP